MKLLVTGSSGFIGHRVVELAHAQGMECLSHRSQKSGALVQEGVIYQDLSADADWREVLSGVETVIHCAARVHQMQDTQRDSLSLYRETNVAGTLTLARQAAESGVKRFVFLSSIKVNGEASLPHHPFTPHVAQPPQDPYGLSKYEAELGLWQIARETGLEVTVIRPPLVYGPGVKANFRTMMHWIRKGLPLPLAAVKNKRSLVFVDNLADLILLCAHHPQAAGETFLVSDEYDVSTAELLADMAKALGVASRVWPLPPRCLLWAAKALGKAPAAERLLGSLQVDIAHTRDRLGWRPIVTYPQALSLTASAYQAERDATD
ncbi:MULTISPECIES: UDP-glucose 4-epimerase family protein [Lonsdalea]|uniref:NAD-dependent dehydratase n=2 Tax=Lonsdalea TaxID=1082702 RepID=A0ACD1JA99_9GAMM|nr:MULTISPECIES: SDR family oxidoreductase [Lonsdalea]OSN00447.1 NAD-dependent dehydratase [Lonsdalea populi]QPQ23604.1 SDR family oxidoreductase [Lonsdalea populi]RAT09841.1 NAD-dependent dehydratase [Lonsdalea quercina]RAT19600.1 NAD-dependent dehydratase [Lonsdalea populi]RAT19976.1 NAD-dependent dehydratase [Lonsdalea populi]